MHDNTKQYSREGRRINKNIRNPFEVDKETGRISIYADSLNMAEIEELLIAMLEMDKKFQKELKAKGGKR